MKKIFLGSFVFLSAFALPPLSHAQTPFGGLDVFEMPCTCSPFMYTVFTPFYLGPIPVTGVLAVPDTPTIYPYYELFPSAWALGLFTPGGQACWMYVGWGCVPLPTAGVMDPFTGTSL